MRIAFFLLGMPIAASATAGQCTAQSGPHTAALVELYTAEGCASCRPADRWLASLHPGGHAPGRMVPVALHMDYRDYLGHPYAGRDVSLRQRKLTHRQRLALVHTPQVLLQGREFRGWGSAAFDEAVAKINAAKAKAALRLDIVSLDAQGLRVAVAAELLQPAHGQEAALYLAAYETRRVSVVLEWQGPFGFPGQTLQMARLLPLLPKALPANSGVVGFVQDRRTGELLQALMLAAC
jgi:hypothetical protein